MTNILEERVIHVRDYFLNFELYWDELDKINPLVVNILYRDKFQK